MIPDPERVTELHGWLIEHLHRVGMVFSKESEAVLKRKAAIAA